MVLSSYLIEMAQLVLHRRVTGTTKEAPKQAQFGYGLVRLASVNLCSSDMGHVIIHLRSVVIIEGQRVWCVLHCNRETERKDSSLLRKAVQPWAPWPVSTGCLRVGRKAVVQP